MITDLLARAASRLLQAAGRRRLAAGLCPACSSSPPRLDCSLCGGEPFTPERAEDGTLDRWADRWRAYGDVIR